MDKLAPDRVDALLEDLTDWSLAGDAIQRTFVFEDFAEAMGFVNRTADLAEAQQHHPDIMIRWNKVTLTISTHDAGGLTEKDFDLATAIGATVPAD